jgi:hypothetical protein
MPARQRVPTASAPTATWSDRPPGPLVEGLSRGDRFDEAIERCT